MSNGGRKELSTVKVTTKKPNKGESKAALTLHQAGTALALTRRCWRADLCCQITIFLDQVVDECLQLGHFRNCVACR